MNRLLLITILVFNVLALASQYRDRQIIDKMLDDTIWTQNAYRVIAANYVARYYRCNGLQALNVVDAQVSRTVAELKSRLRR